jgi:hypothetical protein
MNSWYVAIKKFFAEIFGKKVVSQDARRQREVMLTFAGLKRRGIETPSVFEIHQEMIARGWYTPLAIISSVCASLVDKGFIQNLGNKEGFLYFIVSEKGSEYLRPRTC